MIEIIKTLFTSMVETIKVIPLIFSTANDINPNKFLFEAFVTDLWNTCSQSVVFWVVFSVVVLLIVGLVAWRLCKAPKVVD